jgi:hypothetical protein
LRGEGLKLANMARRIINEVRGINRVVYDLTSKPPRHDQIDRAVERHRSSPAQPPAALPRRPSAKR